MPKFPRIIYLDLISHTIAVPAIQRVMFFLGSAEWDPTISLMSFLNLPLTKQFATETMIRFEMHIPAEALSTEVIRLSLMFSHWHSHGFPICPKTNLWYCGILGVSVLGTAKRDICYGSPVSFTWELDNRALFCVMTHEVSGFLFVEMSECLMGTWGLWYFVKYLWS